jgi:hypothetical protein
MAVIVFYGSDPDKLGNALRGVNRFFIFIWVGIYIGTEHQILPDFKAENQAKLAWKTLNPNLSPRSFVLF